MSHEKYAGSSPVRVGIIGCGNISRNHLQAYEAIDTAEVVGVCDVDLSRANATAKQWGIAYATDSVRDLLRLGVDVVSVCTPHPTHEAVVLDAAAAGVHVLCEKPIAVDMPSAQRMIDACATAGVKFGVLFQRRFWPAAQELRALIDNGPFGRPVLGHASVLLHRKPEYYAADAWRGTWAADGGGVLMTQAIHYLDLLQWYMGPVAEVFGAINTFKHGEHIEVEDSATALLKFTSGAMAIISASTAADPAVGAQIRLTGDNGATAELTEYPEGSDGRLTLKTVDDRIETLSAHPEQVVANIGLAEINGGLTEHHLGQIQQFIEAIQDNAEPAVTGVEASKSLRMLLAIYTSARTKAPVIFEESAPAPAVPDDVLNRLGQF